MYTEYEYLKTCVKLWLTFLNQFNFCFPSSQIMIMSLRKRISKIELFFLSMIRKKNLIFDIQLYILLPWDDKPQSQCLAGHHWPTPSGEVQNPSWFLLLPVAISSPFPTKIQYYNKKLSAEFCNFKWTCIWIASLLSFPINSFIFSVVLSRFCFKAT